MPKCDVCDEMLQPEQKTCHVCGSHVAVAASAPVVAVGAAIPAVPVMNSALTATVDNVDSAEVGFECPDCGQTFDANYGDDFCTCGSELKRRESDRNTPAALPTPPGSNIPSPPVPIPASTSSGAERPPVGTACIVVYSDSKPRTPMRYFAIAKDVLVVGRQDAVRGDFPDIDLSSIVEESTSRKISRRHAEVLRARDTQTYSIRPLPGNTGTQIGKELAVAGQAYPLADGTPIVLGGVVWMKFETIK